MALVLPSGVFFTRYQDEGAYLHTRPQRLWFLGLLAALAVAPAVLGPFALGVATAMLLSLVAVYGLQITTGLAGQLNLGQSGFVGVGAFVGARLTQEGLPFWAVIPLAGIAAGASSVLFGLPAARVKGFYLALTTLAAQVMFPILIIRLPQPWFGGSNGISVDPPRVLGHALASPADMYWLCLAVALVMSALAFNLPRTRVGRAFRAIRDNDIAADVLGVDPLRYKISAFFAGALFAGVSGALTAYYVRYVTTDQFTLAQSVWYVGMLIVGGLHTPLGAILGTVALVLLQELFHALGGRLLAAGLGLPGGFVFALTQMMLGAVIIAGLVFEPRGLAHRWQVVKAAYRLWPYPHD